MCSKNTLRTVCFGERKHNKDLASLSMKNLSEFKQQQIQKNATRVIEKSTETVADQLGVLHFIVCHTLK